MLEGFAQSVRSQSEIADKLPIRRIRFPPQLILAAVL